MCVCVCVCVNHNVTAKSAPSWMFQLPLRAEHPHPPAARTLASQAACKSTLFIITINMSLRSAQCGMTNSAHIPLITQADGVGGDPEPSITHLQQKQNTHEASCSIVTGEEKVEAAGRRAVTSERHPRLTFVTGYKLVGVALKPVFCRKHWTMWHLWVELTLSWSQQFNGSSESF